MLTWTLRATTALLLTVAANATASSVPGDLTGARSPASAIVQHALSTAASDKNLYFLGGASRLQQIARAQAGNGFTHTDFVRPTEYRPSSQVQINSHIEYASAEQPDIFGSTALPVSQAPLDRQWRQASSGGIGQRGLWGGIAERLRFAGRRQQLGAVNDWVNARISFSEDRKVHGRADQWSSGAESLRRGRGDCEDYAIAKMQLLHAIGFSKKDLYLTIVKDLVRQADHAILAVRFEGKFLVLDNETDRILESGQVSDYRPILTYAAGRAWLHGYRKPAVQLASLNNAALIAGTR